MATVQCANNHVYDDSKYHICPYCPVPGLKDANIPGTQAAPLSKPSLARTEAASPQGVTGQTPARGEPGRSSAAGVTVGLVRKLTQIDPVVGWIVCIEGVNKGRDYRLHSDRNTLGRSPNMDVCIEGDETISRENHCQIVFSRRHRTFSIVPGTGRNLIYLDGKDVLAATELKPYAQLDIGEGSYLFLPFCSDRFNWDKPSEKTAVKLQRTNGGNGNEEMPD